MTDDEFDRFRKIYQQRHADRELEIDAAFENLAQRLDEHIASTRETLRSRRILHWLSIAFSSAFIVVACFWGVRLLEVERNVRFPNTAWDPAIVHARTEEAKAKQRTAEKTERNLETFQILLEKWNANLESRVEPQTGETSADSENKGPNP